LSKETKRTKDMRTDEIAAELQRLTTDAIKELQWYRQRYADTYRSDNGEPWSPPEPGPEIDNEDLKRLAMVSRNRSLWRDSVEPEKPAPKNDAAEQRQDAELRRDYIATVEKCRPGVGSIRPGWKTMSLDYLRELARCAAADPDPEPGTAAPEPLDHDSDPARRRMLARNHDLGRS
jgi:hypothetical protein